MDEYTIEEMKYKNGFADGYQKGLQDAVKHGKWEPDIEVFDADPAVGVPGGEFQIGWKCSVCGRCEPEKEPYCHCGARMDK